LRSAISLAHKTSKIISEQLHGLCVIISTCLKHLKELLQDIKPCFNLQRTPMKIFL
jgi:hypothetical protein